jgi:hypothetical protein
VKAVRPQWLVNSVRVEWMQWDVSRVKRLGPRQGWRHVPLGFGLDIRRHRLDGASLRILPLELRCQDTTAAGRMRYFEQTLPSVNHGAYWRAICVCEEDERSSDDGRGRTVWPSRRWVMMTRTSRYQPVLLLEGLNVHHRVSWHLE